MAIEMSKHFHPDIREVPAVLEQHLNPFMYLLERSEYLMSAQLQNLTTHGSVIEFYLEIFNEGLQDANNQTLIFQLNYDYTIYHFFPYNTFSQEKTGKLTSISLPNIPKRSRQSLMFKVNMEESTDEIVYNLFFKPFSPINKNISGSIVHKLIKGRSTILLWIVIIIIVLIAISVIVIYRFTKKRITPIKFVELDKFNAQSNLSSYREGHNQL